MTHKQFEQFILSLPGVWLDYPFGEGTAVYKFG
ncbi:MmcQ/YjbR family DNA-binding protein, partial [Candidatus Saccharibacteria bacterium]|nr:MmcQ/YjbR family DNA-binding protein [Candidatus Saccharibacteria bacterium]